jgi:hypothetical protein
MVSLGCPEQVFFVGTRRGAFVNDNGCLLGERGVSADLRRVEVVQPPASGMAPILKGLDPVQSLRVVE